MCPTPDSKFADLQQIIADLRRQASSAEPSATRPSISIPLFSGAGR